ncbi:uncharacterized protein LOC112892363 [Panicum hallii]|uniref:uncharacterized protein LOC112892363 n=1 Tax=Panicum hallii TaxID=206008 RepID=UPI000DF4E68F|nr:uncharacterized protein LOC112892363 [Panicum hallii]
MAKILLFCLLDPNSITPSARSTAIARGENQESQTGNVPAASHHSLPSPLFSGDHHSSHKTQSPGPAQPEPEPDKAMAAAEPPPPSGTGFFGMLSFRCSATAVASFDPAQDDELLALDALQAHVADRLQALSAHASSPASPALSLPFLSKLLDAVLSSDAAFRAVLAVGPVAAALARPPADRLAADLLDRAVKTLDVLNAASFTLASLRAAHRAALTAATCLLAPALHRAHLARARRAIARLFSGGAGGAEARAGRRPEARAGRRRGGAGGDVACQIRLLA